MKAFISISCHRNWAAEGTGSTGSGGGTCFSEQDAINTRLKSRIRVVMGVRGIKGIKGHKGHKGDKGHRGYKGNKGYKGTDETERSVGYQPTELSPERYS